MSTPSLPTEAFRRAVETNDPADWIAAIRLLEPEVRPVCCNLCRNPEDARDVLQETLFKIFQKRHEYQPERGNVEPWARKIAARTALDFRRKEARGHEALRSLAEEADRPGAQNPKGDSVELEERYRVARTVERLDEPEREALLLRFYFDPPHTYEKIAELLGLANKQQAQRLILDALATSRSCRPCVTRGPPSTAE